MEMALSFLESVWANVSIHFHHREMKLKGIGRKENNTIKKWGAQKWKMR